MLMMIAADKDDDGETSVKIRKDKHKQRARWNLHFFGSESNGIRRGRKIDDGSWSNAKRYSGVVGESLEVSMRLTPSSIQKKRSRETSFSLGRR